MLANISALIERGSIDNTTRDLIDMRLWCIDGLEPLHLRMKGNCLRDIAGCRVNFINNSAGAKLQEEPSVLHSLRHPSGRLFAGDITLSRRVQEPNNRRGLANMLSLEFFGGYQIRFLIESSHFTTDITLPQWKMSWEEDNAQSFINMDMLRNHVAFCVQHFQGSTRSATEEDFPVCAWDERLNRAEAYMAIYPTIHEKYRHTPGGYLSAAYVMDRMDFLGREAQLDESHQPPNPETYNRDWEVMDFVDPDYTGAVAQAMRHPLFMATSLMTAAVQRTLMGGKTHMNVAPRPIERYITIYAGIVSHILATILLSQEGVPYSQQAATRIKLLCDRLSKLAPLCKLLPLETQQELQQAAETLHQRLCDFSATLKP